MLMLCILLDLLQLFTRVFFLELSKQENKLHFFCEHGDWFLKQELT